MVQGRGGSGEAGEEALCAIRHISLRVVDELLESVIKVKGLESVDGLHCDAR